jgi:hypothetical protein
MCKPIICADELVVPYVHEAVEMLSVLPFFADEPDMNCMHSIAPPVAGIILEKYAT